MSGRSMNVSEWFQFVHKAGWVDQERHTRTHARIQPRLSESTNGWMSHSALLGSCEGLGSDELGSLTCGLSAS